MLRNTGHYEYEVERGPEYASLEGSWTISSGQENALRLTLPRLYDLSGQGWYSGELHIHRPIGQIPLLLQASDLYVGPTITWSPGWFLIHALAANKETFRFASTGPFYVPDSRGRQPIDPSAAEFFLTWAKQRRDEISDALEAQQRDEVVANHDQGVVFWERRLLESQR